MNFEQFFKQATGFDTNPFPFQERFATASTVHRLVRVPTGLGKTAAVVLGWLWRRIYAGDAISSVTPRRLVYCLPMRALVEQTAKVASRWLGNLNCQNAISVHVLMGGEQAEDWDLYPERNAILIGTQDMLLSRALNRGYAMSRYRWPIQYGLLNSDCLWVFDEVQLMDVGVATTAQVDAFRRAMQVFGTTESVWMSATLQRNWLDTVDFNLAWLGKPLELNDEDLNLDDVRKRYIDASKPLTRVHAAMGDEKVCAAEISKAHRPGTRTLAIFNTVDRATDVYRELRKAGIGSVLIHSRFRPQDRAAHLKTLLDADEVIAITTQVVEAGVDISSTTLFTDLAPWASLVQRFGRCNRKGEDGEARVIWFDPGDNIEKLAAPYEPQELIDARRALLACEDVSPASLDQISFNTPMEAAHVIRRRDLIDLFDTTPDLAGNDIDVSRYIRSGEDHDVQVFWREFEEGDAPQENAPDREELCPTPVGRFRDFRKKYRDDIWRWDGLDHQWRKTAENEIYPGQTFLVRAAVGGYDSEIGWNSASKRVTPITASTDEHDAQEYDVESSGKWMSIAEHTDDVVQELESILEHLPIEPEHCAHLKSAARRHDWGKAHATFQNAMSAYGPPPEWNERTDIGKARGQSRPNYDRRGFRHELASALAMIQTGLPDLEIYLAAAHHGKVRLSIRSLPNEKPPAGQPGRLFARGVWADDILPATDLGGGVLVPEVTLSLECMQLGRSSDGRPSWAERMLRLREAFGPFRLAYLEAVLRTADMRASKKEARAGGHS